MTQLQRRYIVFSKKDIHRIRELASQVREVAELPIQKENKKLWSAVNDLKMIRPVLHTRDLQAFLLNYEDELTIQTEAPLLQDMELQLLLRIYEWKHLRLDRVVEPFVKCNCIINDSGFGIKVFNSGIGTNFEKTKEVTSSVHFDSQIETFKDLEKIKTPEVHFDKEATMKIYNQMKEVLDGILEVKLFGRHFFRHAPWDDIMTWMGISEGMYKFALEPELMHTAIDRYMKAIISQVKQYEALGLISSNNAFENVGYNGIGYTTQLPPATDSGIGARLKDIWGANADQILTSVSPSMSEEFAFKYEREYSKLFGLYGYGCCERLDHKIDKLVSNFDNLRMISVSPYSDPEKALEQIGSKYVACFKPNSNYFVGDSFSLDYFKKELINICSLSKKYGTNLVINMKTIISLSGDPTRLWKWCDLASDIISNY
jgi:hypothetical protein